MKHSLQHRNYKNAFVLIESRPTANRPDTLFGYCDFEFDPMTLIHELDLAIPKMYRVAPKKLAPFLYALTLPNINRFLKLFHYQNQVKMCNNTITKDHKTPQLCRYATFNCEMLSVLKATIENKTISVTTDFKKLTTGNNLFIVSVVV